MSRNRAPSRSGRPRWSHGNGLAGLLALLWKRVCEMSGRDIRIEGDVAYLPLTRGYVAVIDAADVPLVSGRKWYAWVSSRNDTLVYALSDKKARKDRVCLRLHRVLTACPDGLEVDHIDGNGLNNRRANLRIATRSENARNTGLNARNSSGRKGVSWCKRTRRWVAFIQHCGSTRFLGRFFEIDEAAAAYAKASAELHGEFGRME